MSNAQTQFDAGILIRRSLFVLVLIILTIGNLFTLFRGLSSPHAMDQAQIAREIARGNGFVTKFIRPVAYGEASQHKEAPVPMTNFKDTYHSPLNPLLNAAVLKVVGGDKSDKWSMSNDQVIFPLDRVIATVSTLCFLLAIGMSYLLITRIFDTKIAGVTAILMLFSETFWNYALSGLPQMLMLLLFSCALFFVYKAVEDASEGLSPFAPALIAGLFFTLLAMTNYLAVWVALGYIVFAAVAFRPRGIVGITILLVLIIPSVFVIYRNLGVTGTPFGTAFLNLYNGLGGGNEDQVMRSASIEGSPLIDRGFFSSIVRTTLLQTTSIIPFLGGIIVAPLFFISLMHPFKRTAIANFRWAILLMFAFTAFGLAIFGVSTAPLDPNQIHLLFAPVMTAYGIAFISILWSRLPVVTTAPMLRNAHYIIVIAICALPLIISLPMKVRMGLNNKDRGGVPHWPPYFAPVLTLGPKKWLTESQVCFSDQPWAIAWYADRMSIWLPQTRTDFVQLERKAAGLKTPISGIHISPSSHGSGTAAEVAAKYRDFTSLVLDGRVFLATYPPGVTIYDKDQKIEEILRRYPYRATMIGMDMVFYSDRALHMESN